MRRTSVLVFVLCALTAGAAVLLVIPAGSGGSHQEKLTVTASFYPLAFFAGQIGGDHAQVYDITPAGAEPHDYELTARDIARTEDSRLLILNGGGLEAWGGKIAQTVDPQRTRIVTAGEGLATQTMREEGSAIVDPHLWLAPPLAIEMVGKIADGFSAADPANATYYQSNAAALEEKLHALDGDYRAGLAQCAQTNIVTAHAAFGYMAVAYHLTQVPIAGLSPDAEPSPKALADIAQFVRMHRVQYIFFESLVSPKLAQTIAAETGARTLVLDPLEGLTQDQVAAGADYFTEMRQNLAHIQTALQCTT